MAQITAQHLFEGWFQALEGHAAEQFAAHGLVLAEAAADVNVVAFAFVGADPGAQQADVAHVVLRAGVGASGEMDIDRQIE